MGSIARISSKERIEEEEKIPIEDYFCNDSESSDSSGEEEGGTGLSSLMAGLDESELLKRPEELIDKSLTGLLKKMATFPPPTQAQIEERAVKFGESHRHKTLIFDMDETLIHAEIKQKGEEPITDSDFQITLKNLNEAGEEEEFIVYVKMRPFYDECIENLAKYYEIAVFTAGEQDYADAILNVLDPEGLISHRLYRQHCICVDGRYYVKDLRIIQDRELKDVVLVDNSVISFAYNLDNGVPCAEFYRWTENDEELLYLHSYLDELFHKDDIPAHNAEKFKLGEIQAGKIKAE
jgi:Dullard-like phosphatase family protein